MPPRYANPDSSKAAPVNSYYCLKLEEAVHECSAGACVVGTNQDWFN